jgi:hypothetical protein
MSGYVGPAPVPLDTYFGYVRDQSIMKVGLSRERIETALSALVLDQRTVDLIGQAISSKRAFLIFGASGNGKSAAADCLRSVLPGNILIPRAVQVMHQVIQVFDPSSHEIVGEPGARTAGGRMSDQRWILIKRPVVFAAGELAASHLELVLDEVHKTYEAPIQMKANGGLLVIDDFGRQQLDAAYLLNRWIVPLEKGIDNLSLHNGARFQVPFDVIPMFITNRRPAELADDAFLRRIRYKVEISGPDAERFIEILKRECQKNNLDYRQAAARHLIDKYFKKPGREISWRPLRPPPATRAPTAPSPTPPSTKPAASTSSSATPTCSGTPLGFHVPAGPDVSIGERRPLHPRAQAVQTRYLLGRKA